LKTVLPQVNSPLYLQSSYSPERLVVLAGPKVQPEATTNQQKQKLTCVIFNLGKAAEICLNPLLLPKQKQTEGQGKNTEIIWGNLFTYGSPARRDPEFTSWPANIPVDYKSISCALSSPSKKLLR